MKYYRKTASVMIVVLILFSSAVLPAYATSGNACADCQKGIGDVAPAGIDEEGCHHWASLALALSYYGAALAIYEGRYYDILGAYDRYCIQMSGWRIHFGVNPV